ncbi:hypothetical protein BJY00DRAFT_311028 [Aspergillus carlsbadensis]|nr:hypothetical protein BJY00DRAFT_311028 [Aspergillus carlsbadensis]
MSYPFHLHPTTPIFYNPSVIGTPRSKKAAVGNLKSADRGPGPLNPEAALTLYPYAEPEGSISDYASEITTPFDETFILDPIKLNAATPFLSPVLRVPGPIRHREFRVVDLGCTTAALHDGYPETVNRIRNVQVVRVLPVGGVITKKEEHCHDRGLDLKTCRIMEDGRAVPIIYPHTSASLPLPSGSVDVVIARSLHKDIVGTRGSDFGSGIEANLAECFRVLRHGGILEYIFFERRLRDAGPLAQELEEAWAVDVSASLSTGQFMAGIDRVGFTGGRYLRTVFKLVTLNQLFDEHGRRGGNGMPAALGTGSPRRGDPTLQGAGVLRELQSECEKLGTGWRCVIGWCIKP